MTKFMEELVQRLRDNQRLSDQQRSFLLGCINNGELGCESTWGHRTICSKLHASAETLVDCGFQKPRPHAFPGG
jgi:hypothetical protein